MECFPALLVPQYPCATKSLLARCKTKTGLAGNARNAFKYITIV